MATLIFIAFGLIIMITYALFLFVIGIRKNEKWTKKTIRLMEHIRHSRWILGLTSGFGGFMLVMGFFLYKEDRIQHLSIKFSPIVGLIFALWFCFVTIRFEFEEYKNGYVAGFIFLSGLVALLLYLYLMYALQYLEWI